MKFILSLFVAQALAFSLDTRSPALVSRQAAADITSSIADIQSATQSLNTAITAGDLLALASGNGAVVGAINAATTKANALSTLSFDDAASLANPIQDLARSVESTITNLINRADSLSAVREAVLAGLTDQQAASMAFSAALLSKIPENLQGIAQNLAQPIADSLNRGVAAFSTSSASGGATIQTSTPSAREMSAPAYQGSFPPSSTPTYQASFPPTTPTYQASFPPTTSTYQGSYPPQTTATGSYIPPSPPKPLATDWFSSYSFPGSNPTTSAPATYTGAAAPAAHVGMGAFAAGVIAAVAAL